MKNDKKLKNSNIELTELYEGRAYGCLIAVSEDKAILKKYLTTTRELKKSEFEISKIMINSEDIPNLEKIIIDDKISISKRKKIYMTSIECDIIEHDWEIFLEEYRLAVISLKSISPVVKSYDLGKYLMIKDIIQILKQDFEYGCMNINTRRKVYKNFRKNHIILNCDILTYINHIEIFKSNKSLDDEYKNKIN